nr:reverse transcriptase domain-containing protein [Tanacetum cinerariifolium]GFA44261.1 reverse transcriptase domain-containing protein [Tanacetum cinerariifolium]
MLPWMITRSAGRQTAAPRDGQRGDRSIRVNGGIEEVPEFSTVITQQLQDLLPTIIAQVGNHASNIQGDVRSINVGNGQNGCSCKEFIVSNPKDYNGKGSAIAYNRWIEKMESVQDISGHEVNQKVKYTASSFIDKALTWWNTQVQTRGREAVVGMIWEDFKVLIRKELCPNNEMQKLETEFCCHAMVGAGHAAYTDRFHELARLVPHLVTLENKRIERYIYGLALQIHTMVAATEPTIIQSVVLKICVMVAATELTTIQSTVLKAGMLTDEVIRNGSLNKNTKTRGNSGEPSKDENARDNNKRSRTGRAFATTTNLTMREYTGVAPKCTKCNYHHLPETPCHMCIKCNRFRHFTRDCRVGPRMVNPLNARNPIAARGEGGQGHGNNGNPVREGAFMMGAEEVR